MRIWVSMLAVVAMAALPVAAEAQSGSELHFSYTMPGNGPYVRQASGTIEYPEDFRNLLEMLRPPKGAHGAYGLIGDDDLLGAKPGDGLRMLGDLARKYISFSSIYVVQPPGYENIGVQSGTFTDVNQLNDTTLGWVFFDLRPQFEASLKDKLGPDPAPQSHYMVFFDREVRGVTSSGLSVVRLAALAYSALHATRIDIVGHADTAEADSATWKTDAQSAVSDCATLSQAARDDEPICAFNDADAFRLGYMRAQEIAEDITLYGVPAEAIHISSAGADDPMVQTPAATSEPQNRFVSVTIQ